MPLSRRLRHSAIIERPVKGARNEHGIPTETFSPLRTIRCWYQPAIRKEQQEDSSSGAIVESGVVFMEPTDITEADRLVISGSTYRVLDVHNAAGKDQHYEVMVKRVEVD